MEQRDYLTKQAEELGRVLGKIVAELLKLKSQGKSDREAIILNNALIHEFDFDIEKLKSLENIEWINYLTSDKKLTTGQLSHLADFLFQTADFFNNESIRIYQKVVLIYNYVNEIEKTFSRERQNNIAYINRTHKTR